MKESQRKGVANRPDPESWVASRKATIEALTGAHAGRTLSCELIATGAPTSFRKAEGNTGGCAIASVRSSAQSETPGMRVKSTPENRETPTPAEEEDAGPFKKALSQKSNMYVSWGVGRSNSAFEVTPSWTQIRTSELSDLHPVRRKTFFATCYVASARSS
jgi:hypothetical protein